MVNKFATIERFNLSGRSFNFPKQTRKYNHCLVYAVWSNEHYLSFLFISLVSQFKFTDVATIDIKIFVSRSLARKAAELLVRFPIEFVIMEGTFNKFSITIHPELQQYERITICDCDTFMFKQEGSCPFYESLEQQDNILMMRDPEENSRKVFDSRLTLCFGIKSMEAYLQTFYDLLDVTPEFFSNFFTEHQWYLSCLMFYPRRLFSSTGWSDYANKWLAKTMFCDETVFLTHAWKHGYLINDFEDILQDVSTITANKVETYFKQPECFGIVHPLHGSYCEDLSIQTIYHKLLNVQNVNLANDIVLKKHIRKDFFDHITDLLPIINQDDAFTRIESHDKKQLTCILEKVVGEELYHKTPQEQAAAYWQVLPALERLYSHGYFHTSADQMGNVFTTISGIKICDLDSIFPVVTDRQVAKCYARVVKKFFELCNLPYPYQEMTIEDFQELTKHQAYFNCYQNFTWENTIVSGQHDSRKKLNKLPIPGLNGKKVVDVGSAEGFFALHAQKLGANVTAIEKNKKACEILSSISNNIEIINGKAESILAQAESYDVGFCLSVLHCVSDPLLLIRLISSKVRLAFFEIEIFHDSPSNNEVKMKRLLFKDNRIKWQICKQDLENYLNRYFEWSEIGRTLSNRVLYECHSLSLSPKKEKDLESDIPDAEGSTRFSY